MRNVPWTLQRARQGGLRYAPPDVVEDVDDDALLGALAAAAEEHGVQDPANLASVVDWQRLPRHGEPIDAYRARVYGEPDPGREPT